MIFALQVIASFLIGGSYIAGTTVLAERVSPRLAGVLTGLPTTMLVSFSFLAWTNSLKEAGRAIGSTPAVIGGSIMFLVVYILLGERPIYIKYAGALLVWTSISFTFASFHITNLIISMAVCIAAFILSQYLFRNMQDHEAVKIHYTRGEMIFRFCFAGGVIATAIILGRVSGPIWGAVFSAYPATFTSTLIILNHRHGTSIIRSMARTMPIGSFGSAFFAVSFSTLSQYTNFGVVVILSYAISMVFCFGYLFFKDNLVKT